MGPFVERFKQVRQMPASPEKYWAMYCLTVLKEIEEGKPYEVMSKYQGTNFKNGIRRFFGIETEIKHVGDRLELHLKTNTNENQQTNA